MYTTLKADLSFEDPQELSGLFSQSAKMTPNNIAVIHGNNKITYKELDLLSNRYADYLHKAHDIKQGDFVCVAYDRGINFIISIISILKCGAVYVPIDTKDPKEHRQHILDDVKPKVILLQPEYKSIFNCPNCISIEDTKNISTYSHKPRAVNRGSQDIACVFFTSGSTGRPKGVLLPHLALTGLIRSPRYLKITKEDRVLSSSSIAFDAASFEIWTALGNSATLVCMDYETIINPESFADFLDHEDITVMWITSALFDQVVAFRPEMFKKVKYLLSGGDVVNPKTVYKVLNNKQGRPKAFINGYGPTETGILATFQIIREMDDDRTPLPIGKALSDIVLYVLDDELKPLPEGEAGELFIGGDRLAKGYLNLPDQTHDKFIRNPFTGNPTDTLYKTGDLVKFRPDGSLDFIGRADRQIKFRGFRLELDGIENNLISHPEIANAAVKLLAINGEKKLVAYVQPEKSCCSSFDLKAYKAFLLGKMPSYSVPSIFTVMEHLPVTSRGKIDRKRLPKPVFQNEIRTNIIPPETEMEKIIHAVWKKSLPNTNFGITDSFFDIGGSSILLGAVYTEIRRKISIPFSLNAFFENPTIQALAQSITRGSNKFKHECEFTMAKSDAQLNENIRPSWNRDKQKNKNAILLTGTTGFLGTHILAELLEETERPIYCLIRPHNEEALIERQRKAFTDFGVKHSIKHLDRIHYLAGDLSDHALGLCQLDYHHIVDNCSHIIHCGAYVHHIYPYSRLKASNTQSTLELIKIAMKGCPKKLSFISTISAITKKNEQGLAIENQVGEEPPSFFGGYALSKWASERLMKQAFDRGMNGLILRPGNIFANSTTGSCSPVTSNFALLMMRSYLASGIAPDLDFNFEAVPVDLLAKSIVSTTLGKSDRLILNLSNPKEISLREYTNLLGDLTEKPIKLVPFEEWKKKVIAPLTKSSPLYPLTLYFQEGASQEFSYFETVKGQKELGKYAISFPDDYSLLLKDAFKKTLRQALLAKSSSWRC